MTRAYFIDAGTQEASGTEQEYNLTDIVFAKNATKAKYIFWKAYKDKSQIGAYTAGWCQTCRSLGKDYEREEGLLQAGDPLSEELWAAVEKLPTIVSIPAGVDISNPSRG